MMLPRIVDQFGRSAAIFLEKGKKIGKRALAVYAASYLVWGLFLFDRLIAVFSRFTKDFYPAGWALVPIFIAAVAAVFSLALALLTRRAKESTFLQITLLVGIALDVGGYAIFGFTSTLILLPVGLHITALGFMIAASRKKFTQVAYVVGGFMFFFSWTAVPVCMQGNSCGAYTCISPTLAVQGYRGFNVICYSGSYYAILQSEGAFDIGKIQSNGYSVSFVGNSVRSVERLIDSYGLPATLVVQGYKGYNIILYNDTYYAILQSEGAFGMSKINSHAYSSCFFGPSVAAVEQLIDANASLPQSRCLGP